MTSPYGAGAAERVEYQGKMRQVRGRPRYPDPPEPGTILGPVDREYLVVLGTDERGTMIGLATAPDMAAIPMGEPRSKIERQLQGSGWGGYLSQAAALANVRLPMGVQGAIG